MGLSFFGFFTTDERGSTQILFHGFSVLPPEDEGDENNGGESEADCCIHQGRVGIEAKLVEKIGDEGVRQEVFAAHPLDLPVPVGERAIPDHPHPRPGPQPEKRGDGHAPAMQAADAARDPAQQVEAGDGEVENVERDVEEEERHMHSDQAGSSIVLAEVAKMRG